MILSLFFCKINGPMVRWSNGPIISILQFLRHFQFFESKNYILLSTYPGSSYVITYFFVDFLTYWVRYILELQFESFLKKERIKWTHFFGKSSWKIRIKNFCLLFRKIKPITVFLSLKIWKCCLKIIIHTSVCSTKLQKVSNFIFSWRNICNI